MAKKNATSTSKGSDDQPPPKVSNSQATSGACSQPGSRHPSGGRDEGFPVVGIGASAGGLEALEELIGSFGAEMGLAFVVVTHLRPGHTSLLPELLGRESQMPVVQVTDGA